MFGQTLPFIRVKGIATRTQAPLQSLVLLSHHHRTDGALTTLRIRCLLTALRVLPFQHKDFRSNSPFLFRPPHDVLFPRHLFQSPQFHTQVQCHTMFTEPASRQTLQFHRTYCPNVRSCRETRSKESSTTTSPDKALDRSTASQRATTNQHPVAATCIAIADRSVLQQSHHRGFTHACCNWLSLANPLTPNTNSGTQVPQFS